MDRLKEECGVFGIHNNSDASAFTAGTYNLQLSQIKSAYDELIFRDFAWGFRIFWR